jgi:uncharacterized protein (UPF0548 family)
MDDVAIPARVARALDSLPGREVNFDPARLDQLSKSDPWHIDEYCTELPAEPPGPPLPEGSFMVARRLMLDYEFAEPSVVRAYYDARVPLKSRDMLLEIRYLLLRLLVGVRITTVFDELREVGDRPVRVWGWAYRTLEGHLERGQMDYQIWKWLDSGQVEFRIHAVSEIAEIPNPIIRVGFRLLGRRRQIRFARECGARMKRFTREGLGAPQVERRPAVISGVARSPSGTQARTWLFAERWTDRAHGERPSSGSTKKTFRRVGK